MAPRQGVTFNFGGGEGNVKGDEGASVPAFSLRMKKNRCAREIP